MTEILITDVHMTVTAISSNKKRKKSSDQADHKKSKGAKGTPGMKCSKGNTTARFTIISERLDTGKLND